MRAPSSQPAARWGKRRQNVDNDATTHLNRIRFATKFGEADKHLWASGHRSKVDFVIHRHPSSSIVILGRRRIDAIESTTTHRGPARQRLLQFAHGIVRQLKEHLKCDSCCEMAIRVVFFFAKRQRNAPPLALSSGSSPQTAADRRPSPSKQCPTTKRQPGTEKQKSTSISLSARSLDPTIGTLAV